jgi:hypothetical protein
MLVLDSHLNDLQTPELINHIKGPKVKVRLAGFIIGKCCNSAIYIMVNAESN